MKKIFITIIITLIAFPNFLGAQDWNPEIYRVGKKYPGYVITLANDTIHGFIEAQERATNIPLMNDNQTKCFFYKNETDRKATNKYNPKDIKGYMIADKFYKSINYSGGLTRSLSFCLQISNGRISCYDYYKMKEGGEKMFKKDDESWDEYFNRKFESTRLYQHLSDDPISWPALGLSFAKKVSELVKDYPELSEKVKNKEEGYKILSFGKILTEYEAHFAGK